MAHKIALSGTYVFGASSALVFLLVGFWLLLKLVPLPLLQEVRGSSQVLFDRNGELLNLSLSRDEKYRLIAPYSDISPAMIQATLLYEDRYFFYHPGFNPVAIVRAGVNSFFRPERLIGGSTITMQLVRLRMKLKTRSIQGKLRQIFWALAAESQYSKEEILGAYLNVAPYGANIEGAAAASLIYFHKPISTVTADEALTLAVLPQHPALRWRKKGRTSLDKGQRELLRRWVDVYPAQAAIPKELTYSPAEIPSIAPHLFNRLKQLYPQTNQYPSALDGKLQGIADDVLESSLCRYREIGVKNGAMILVEAPNLAVRSYVGSADYLGLEISGFVNGLSAPRSPGSLLKPFIYALGIEQGRITPETMLSDLPLRIAAYNPENFERNFLGPISATDALVKSRNIPALQVFRMLQPSSLYKFLKQSNVQRLKEESYYGLALVLGGLGISAEEIAVLYGILKNDGELRQLQFLERDVQGAAPKLLSREASYLVKEMLSKNPPPFIRFGSLNIPWKTGTSYGSKDAWAAGIVGQYVLVVWLGNFDGRPNPNLVGRDVAGPVFFSVVERLLDQGVFPAVVSSAGLNLKQIDVCALTGALPGPDCPHLKKSWFIPGVSPIAKCNLHKKVKINPETGLRFCTGNDERGGEERVYEVWDSAMQNLFQRAGLSRSMPPPYPQECKIPSSSNGSLRIISPEEHIEYYLEAHRALELQFLASVPGESKRVSWFVDDLFIAQVEPTETVSWRAKAGSFSIRAVDDLGNASVVKIAVRTMGE